MSGHFISFHIKCGSLDGGWCFVKWVLILTVSGPELVGYHFILYPVSISSGLGFIRIIFILLAVVESKTYLSALIL